MPAARTSDRLDDASDLHGVERVGWGFHITEVVSEYRALRASVLRLWRESLPQPDLNDIDDITRFNESLDQSLARGVGSYSKRIDESRQMFLAILSHDLRNPLNTIRMAAHVVSRQNEDPATANAISVITRNTDAMMQLIGDLIDFSSSGLGRAMPLNRGPVDLEALCREVIDSFRALHPGRDAAPSLRRRRQRRVGCGPNPPGRLQPDGQRHSAWVARGADRPVGGFKRNGFSGFRPGRIHRGVERP